MSVHGIYPVVTSEAHLRAVLLVLNAGKWPFIKMGWRKIALSLPRLENGEPINFATLSAYAHGRKIKNREHRKLLGLAPHGTKYQHATIRKDDPESAVRSLKKLVDPDVLAEIKKGL